MYEFIWIKSGQFVFNVCSLSLSETATNQWLNVRASMHKEHKTKLNVYGRYLICFSLSKIVWYIMNILKEVVQPKVCGIMHIFAQTTELFVQINWHWFPISQPFKWNMNTSMYYVFYCPFLFHIPLRHNNREHQIKKSILQPVYTEMIFSLNCSIRHCLKTIHYLSNNKLSNQTNRLAVKSWI